MQKEHDFTQGAILPALLKFALPVLLALLLQAMYGAVDLQVVGKFGTAADISAVIAAAWEYLKAYAIDCLLTSFLFCFTGYFNGHGNTVFVMFQGFAGAIGVRLPVAFLMSRVSPGSLLHLGLSTPASTVVQILLCLGWYLWQKRKYDALSAPAAG